MNLKKDLASVAEAASKIMAEKLHPNQQKLDVHEPEKDKLTAQDFKKLRSMKKEETEQLKEYEAKDGVYRHKGTYGSAKGAEYGDTDYSKENEMAKDADKPKKPARGKYGARQNFKRSTRVNEDFSKLISSLKDGGLKALEEGMKEMKAKKEMKEEADNEQFHSEVEKAKKKNAGEDRNDAGIAAAATQGVKIKTEQTHTQVEVIDMTDPYDIKKDTVNLDEREMTEPEMKKREEIVKSMKKGMQGFKDRYGDRAKNVMYATATKQAMKD